MKKINVASIRVNFIYNTMYQILAIFIPLVTTPYLSRVLGAEKIGVFSYAFSVVYYFGLFAMLGVNNYGNRSIAQVRDDEELRSRVFWGIYTLQIIASMAMALLYAMYVMFLADDKTIGWIMILYVISSGIDINWVFFGLEQFKLTTLRNVFVKLFTVIGVFSFVKKPSDVYVYALLYVLSQLISQLVLWITLHNYIHIYKVSFAEIIQHIKPNLVLFLPVLAVSLYKIMDKIMLGLMASKTEVGYYESSERVIQVPVALISSLGTVMLPRISNLVANKQAELSEQYLEKSLLFAVFLASSMGFGIMGVAKEFVPIFYGNGFGTCIWIFQVLLPSCLFLAFANVIRTQYLIPNRRDFAFTVSIFTGAMVNLIVNALLIPSFKSVGAGIGTLCAEAAVCIAQCIYVRNELNIRKYIINSVQFLVSGVLMYLVIFNLTIEGMSGFWLLVLKTIIGASIYLLTLYIELKFQKKTIRSLMK